MRTTRFAYLVDINYNIDLGVHIHFNNSFLEDVCTKRIQTSQII